MASVEALAPAAATHAVTVLVVDDSPEDAEVVRRHLRRAANALATDRAYAVRHVQLGADALAAVRDAPRRPDVMLLDHGLPDMSGLEVLDALAAEPGGSPVPVVMLTGTHAHIDTAVAAMRRGALDYLAKDQLSADALRRAVDNALARFEAARLVAAQRDELERLYAAEHRARGEAEAARAEAERANQAKAQFLAAMSHELRTPLNAIGGYAELMQLGIRGPVTAEQTEDLGRIRRAGQHLQALINDILNHARIEAGRVRYDVQAVPLDALVADVEALVAPQLRARGLAFAYHTCGAPALRADPEKVRQVLLNLLANAVKFTEPGGRVDVTCETVDGRVCVHVRDTGRGIPAPALAQVFEPFVQVDRHRTPDGQQGVGLGLAISRDLARGMGGDLTAVSAVGVGSTFTLVLPAA